MSIEEIVQAWKADEEDPRTSILANPVGEGLTEQELREVVGGMRCGDPAPTCLLITICTIDTCSFYTL